jgi:hypothetical protein
MACGVLCLVYFCVNLFSQLYYDRRDNGGKNERQLVKINLYTLLMSTPFMPFLFLRLFVFMFSNLAWQLVGVKYYMKKKILLFIMLFSVTNLLAWSAMGLISYRYHGKLVEYFMH